MPLSRHFRREQRLRLWGRLAALTVLGLLFASAPLWGDSASTTADLGLLLLGVAILALGFGGATIWVWQAPAGVSMTADGIRVGLSTARLWGRIVAGLGCAAFLVWAVAVTLPGGLIMVPVLLLPLVLLPDALRGLLRRPHLLLTPDRLSVVGWAFDADVAWADVVDAEIAAPRVGWPVVRVRLRANAPSFRARYHRLAQRLDVPRDNAFDLPLLAVGEPGRLVVYLRAMAELSRGERVAHLSAAGARFLDGSMSTAPISAAPEQGDRYSRGT